MHQLPAGSGSAGWVTRPEAPDGVDVADVIRTMRRQWRAVVGFLALGVVGALAIVLFAPRRFEGRATLLARGGNTETGGSILGRLTAVGGLMSGGAFSGLPAPFETELQMLRSRAVAGHVVDSLQLQFSVRSPAGVAPLAVVEASELAGRFQPRKYTFERDGRGAYRVQHAGRVYVLAPGTPGRLDIGSVTLRREALPDKFTLKVYDREDAITRFTKRLVANKAGGEVARVVYRGDDSVTAAAAANLVVATYLDRRRTVDRGANQRRLEYVTEQFEGTARELSERERQLREYQERSGVIDAELMGEAWLGGAVALRESLTTVIVDENSIRRLLDQTERGEMSPRQLAAYPAFLRGSAVSSLAGQLTDLETQKRRLLERRTERDPEVIALDQNIRSVEQQVLGLARTYAGSVTDHRQGLSRQLDSLQKRLLKLPAAAEVGGRLQRDVIRLTSIYTALQAQLVEARLAAIGEGGEVRQIDVAQPGREPAFPRPWLTMGIGTLGGLLAGSIAALFLGWFGRWLRDPIEIERATGVTAQLLDPQAPLLISGNVSRTVLVLPLADNADSHAVAQRLANTASARSLRTNVLDLTNAHSNGAEANPSHLIDKLEAEGDMLVVRLPALGSDTAIAALRENRAVLLVAPPGPVDRARLGTAVDTLRRLGVPCAGVVMSEPARVVRV